MCSFLPTIIKLMRVLKEEGKQFEIMFSQLKIQAEKFHPHLEAVFVYFNGHTGFVDLP